MRLIVHSPHSHLFPASLRPVALTVVMAVAAIARSGAQDLSLVASPNPAAVYQKVTLSTIVPADNPAAVSADFPSGLGRIHVVSGPYVQPYLDNESPGTSKVRVSFVVEGNEAGRIVIPPLAVTVGNRERKTQPIVMAFGIERGNVLTIPLQAAWRLPNEKQGVSLFAGEAIPVVLELRNELGETKASSVQLSHPPAGFEEVPEFAAPAKRTVGTSTLYDVPVDSYILSPAAAGTVTLPAATVTAGGRSGSAVPRTVQILPIPNAVSSSGAIGALAFRAWTTTRTVVGGEEISLHLRVEGTGNLPRIVLPSPSAGGLLEVDRLENRSIKPGSMGYSGFRETVYRYLFQSPTTGQGDQGTINPSGRPAANIVVPSFTWLDPDSGAVETVPEKTFTVVLPGSAQGRSSMSSSASTQTLAAPEGSSSSARAVRGELAGFPFKLRSAASVRSSEYHELYSHSDTYLWLLPGPIVFGIFLLLRPRRKKGGGGLAAAVFMALLTSCAIAPVHDTVSKGTTAYREGRFDAAAADFLAAQKIYPRNAALSFDLALAEYRLGRYGEAIHSLRTAIYFAPLAPDYREALDWMVKQIGVPEQVPPAYPIHPDLFLLALIISVNAAAILGMLVLLRRTGGLAIALILFLVVAVISAGGLGYTAIKRSVETAVVKSSGTEMTKIPMAVAGRWLELPAGMAVRILDDADGYYLVETAYGNTGWVKKNRVLVDGRVATKALSISAK